MLCFSPCWLAGTHTQAHTCTGWKVSLRMIIALLERHEDQLYGTDQVGIAMMGLRKAAMVSLCSSPLPLNTLARTLPLPHPVTFSLLALLLSRWTTMWRPSSRFCLSVSVLCCLRSFKIAASNPPECLLVVFAFPPHRFTTSQSAFRIPRFGRRGLRRRRRRALRAMELPEDIPVRKSREQIFSAASPSSS